MSLHQQASPPAPTTTDHGSATEISAIHPDIIESHILTRLDGPTLTSTSCTSSTLHFLSSQPHLWSHICHSTFPSTASSPLLRHLISTFPGGPRSFFSLSYPLPTNPSTNPHLPLPTQLISAVDINYHNTLIFSKVQETETVSSWFNCSPFRIDLIDPKDIIPTKIPHPDDNNCTAILNDMTLSWILIDPKGHQAVNLSSIKPVLVYRHWLTREIQVRFGSVLARDQKSSTELVSCEILVTCSASEGGEMQVSEVSLQVEDMEGMHLNGRESLGILERVSGGKRGKIGVEREEEGRRRYREYVEKKRERRERKMRTEGVLDMLCVGFGVIAVGAFCFFVLYR